MQFFETDDMGGSLTSDPWQIDHATQVAVQIWTTSDVTDAVSGAETFDLQNGGTLTLQVDGGNTQTVSVATGDFVDIDAATASELADAINADVTGATAAAAAGVVTITSDSGGTITIVGGTDRAAMGFATIDHEGTISLQGSLDGTHWEMIEEYTVANTDETTQLTDLLTAARYLRLVYTRTAGGGRISAVGFLKRKAS